MTKADLVLALRETIKNLSSGNDPDGQDDPACNAFEVFLRMVENTVPEAS